MVKQNKNNHSNIETIASNLGMAVVALAAVLHVAELPHEGDRYQTATLQPTYVTSQSADTHSEEMRRSGREEVRHSSATFGAIMRSHPTAGSQ